MKHKFLPLICMINLISIGIATSQTSSFEIPTTNTRAKIQQRVAATDIEVVYNRPSVKGRKIFGDLVQYGQIWRTGSDASTKISFSTPVFINGTIIQAGTYELFSIPDKTEWIIIFQENRSQWGSYSYDSQFDIARIKVYPKVIDYLIETFTISLDDITSNSAVLNISWEKTQVPIHITINIENTVVPLIEAELAKDGNKPYFRAAMFYFENNLDINRAAELMKKALEQTPDHIGMLYRLALILERQGDIEGAIDAAQRSLELSSKANRELLEEYTKLNTAILTRLTNRDK